MVGLAQIQLQKILKDQNNQLRTYHIKKLKGALNEAKVAEEILEDERRDPLEAIQVCQKILNNAQKFLFLDIQRIRSSDGGY